MSFVTRLLLFLILLPSASRHLCPFLFHTVCLKKATRIHASMSSVLVVGLTGPSGVGKSTQATRSVVLSVLSVCACVALSVSVFVGLSLFMQFSSVLPRSFRSFLKVLHTE